MRCKCPCALAFGLVVLLFGSSTARAQLSSLPYWVARR